MAKIIDVADANNQINAMLVFINSPIFFRNLACSFFMQFVENASQKITARD